MTRSTRGLICVSVLVTEVTAISPMVAPLSDLIDVIEIRMDGLRTPLTADGIVDLGKPVLVTNRPTWEGGLFAGKEEDRIARLNQAMELGVGYVDIELQTALQWRAALCAKAKKTGTQVVISHHDFQGTPSGEQLSIILQQMITSGADIGKIVTTAVTPLDTLRVLDLQHEARAAGFPLSAFCMGAVGAISRFASVYLGGYMTYVAPSPEQATAPGQITAQDMHLLTSFLQAA
ncbi:MAG: type I 3-dehydroquinate dehydratase [Desulfobulbus oligotrophicus]|nr:type I 3-dehydroquinate dehydratase [Desulfobulbus oligotrophicus]